MPIQNSRVSGRAVRGAGIVVAAWGLGFVAGFFGHDPAGNPGWIVAEVLFVVLILVGLVVAVRTASGWWGPLFAGMLLAGTYIAGLNGDYAAHAVGWHGESLDHYGGEMGPRAGIVLGTIFVAPPLFVSGCIMGFIARLVVLRRPAPSA